ncbi:hypothetical protein ACFZDK_44605 [Streptomyces sp. NPDC007901]|uniref:hypothetical protein n=1 Tax=Streptomyces sp. NPDC007901 TaxID=3364785 RepID=UPI0036E04A5A
MLRTVTAGSDRSPTRAGSTAHRSGRTRGGHAARQPVGADAARPRVSTDKAHPSAATDESVHRVPRGRARARSAGDLGTGR